MDSEAMIVPTGHPRGAQRFLQQRIVREGPLGRLCDVRVRLSGDATTPSDDVAVDIDDDESDQQ